MYIENIQTPHPSKGEGQPLVAVIDQLAADIPNPVGQERLHRISAALLHVHQALRTPEGEFATGLGSGNVLETLQTLQITNCLGYAALGLGALRHLGEDHRVVFINGHASLVVEDEERQLHFFDPLSPHLNGPISRGMSATTDEIDSQIAVNGRSLADINGYVFARGEKDYSQLVQSFGHAWLTAEDPMLNRQHEERVGRKRHHPSRLIMSIYDAKTGQAVLESYAAFKHCLATGETTEAAKHLRNMSGLYPEGDARTKHYEIDQLVDQLCCAREFAVAADAIEHYFSSFRGLTNDPRFDAMEASLLSKIATLSGDKRIAGEAASRYRNASILSERYRHPLTPALWMAKAVRLSKLFGLTNAERLETA